MSEMRLNAGNICECWCGNLVDEIDTNQSLIRNVSQKYLNANINLAIDDILLT